MQRSSTIMWCTMSVTALALGSALSWGTADFIGGLKTRSLSVAAVSVSSQLAGATILGVLIAMVAPAAPSSRTLLFGILAGGANAIGLVAFYRGLAIGRMSVVAPIAGLGVVVPVTVGLAAGERPGALQGAGMVVAVIGVALSTRQQSSEPARDTRRSVLLAAGAALGIGGNLALLEQGVHHAGDGAVLWAVLCSRLAAAVVLTAPVLTRCRPRLPRAGDVRALVLLGASDLLANLLYGFAVRTSLLSLAAVLASLHPAVTIVLARTMLSERMRAVQQLGVVLAIAGACLLSAA